MAATQTALREALDAEIVRTRPRSPDHARALSRSVADGRLHRILPGCFVERSWWDGASAEQRHVVVARAVSGRIPPDAVLSHRTAAVLHRVPLLDDPPPRVEFVRPGDTRSGTTRYAAQRADQSPWDATTARLFDRFAATTLARTAVDLASCLAFDGAVVALDDTLARGVDRTGLDRELLRRGPRGRMRALRALDVADPLSGSPGESLLRLRLRELGAPPPVLQHRFRDPDLPDAIVDFWFPDHGVVVEFDGAVKYLDRRMRAGRTPEEVVVAEKLREDGLRARAEVRTVVRIVWADLFDAPRLARRLRAAGLPLRWA